MFQPVELRYICDLYFVLFLFGNGLIREINLMHCSLMIFKFGAADEIFQKNWAHALAAGLLALCVARSLVTLILTILEKQALVFCENGFQYVEV